MSVGFGSSISRAVIEDRYSCRCAPARAGWVRQRREQQLRRFECCRVSGQVGVDIDQRGLARGPALVCIHPPCSDVERHPGTRVTHAHAPNECESAPSGSLGEIEIPGAGKNHGEVVVLTPEQRRAVDDALAGYLAKAIRLGKPRSYPLTSDVCRVQTPPIHRLSMGICHDRSTSFKALSIFSSSRRSPGDQRTDTRSRAGSNSSPGKCSA
jgi:hypothetical protein